MKRTEYIICCGKKNCYDVYRTILTDGERFFVKWNGELVDVTERVKNREHTRKNIGVWH